MASDGDTEIISSVRDGARTHRWAIRFLSLGACVEEGRLAAAPFHLGQPFLAALQVWGAVPIPE